jgi:phenylalanyl-tRNA synthetase beta chain
MKFTLAWLKEHLETDAGLLPIVDKLTMIGLEVEKVDDRGRLLAPFSIARVISAEQHPNADRLRVCIVDTGSGDPVQVVCGAPNVRAGMKGVFVSPGAYIPGKDMTLAVGKIRGVESHGMLVSEYELQISDDHEGIIELLPDAPVGVSYAHWAGLDDPIIEINLTPNRADCTGVNGIARDLGAAGIGKFIDRPPHPVTGRFPCPVRVALAFGAAPSLCPAFSLRMVRGVKNGPSPAWLQRRLHDIGLRPINALVDITNFITYDRGRPLHVFDAAKVHGDLTVRRARKDESLLALDGKRYVLDESMCVIADERGVESLAGIMGGEETGCTNSTTDVLIESALWEPANIAQTGRKLGVTSDARYRFERGVDPAFMLPGLELATKMVLELCGGEPSDVFVAGKIDIPRRSVDFPVAELTRLTGLELGGPEIAAVLGRLGFEAIQSSSSSLRVTVPSWRGDIEGKADLVEEIVRIIGVDRVPSVPFDRGEAPRKPILTPIQRRRRKASRALAARGMIEAVTWSFIAPGHASFFGGKPELTLANPISAELSQMRPSLIPGLALAVQRNSDRGFPDTALFEVGQIFTGEAAEDQLTSAAGVRHRWAKPGGSGRHWSRPTAGVDAFDAKADALAALIAAGVSGQALQIVPGAPGWFHPGRSGTVQMGAQNVLGHFGELHPRAMELLDVEGPLVAFEVVLDRIPQPKSKTTHTRPALELSPFQPVERDFAFVIERGVRAADVVRAAQNAERKLISAVSVFDVYEGRGIEPGKKSIAISVTLQPREKTLTEQEIDAVANKIVAEVSKRTGATLRS